MSICNREDILIIGCGNLLRSDDGVGPVLIRALLDRGLPEGVGVADAGTSGMDVAFRMRGVPHIIFVDACTSGAEPGAIFELPGDEAASAPLEAAGNLHSFRWDHAIPFAKWLLKEDYPTDIRVFLIEAENTAPGMELSATVRSAMNEVVELLFDRIESIRASERTAQCASN